MQKQKRKLDREVSRLLESVVAHPDLDYDHDDVKQLEEQVSEMCLNAYALIFRIHVYSIHSTSDETHCLLIHLQRSHYKSLFHHLHK